MELTAREKFIKLLLQIEDDDKENNSAITNLIIKKIFNLSNEDGIFSLSYDSSKQEWEFEASYRVSDKYSPIRITLLILLGNKIKYQCFFEFNKTKYFNNIIIKDKQDIEDIVEYVKEFRRGLENE